MLALTYPSTSTPEGEWETLTISYAGRHRQQVRFGTPEILTGIRVEWSAPSLVVEPNRSVQVRVRIRRSTPFSRRRDLCVIVPLQARLDDGTSVIESITVELKPSSELRAGCLIASLSAFVGILIAGVAIIIYTQIERGPLVITETAAASATSNPVTVTTAPAEPIQSPPITVTPSLIPTQVPVTVEIPTLLPTTQPPTPVPPTAIPASFTIQSSRGNLREGPGTGYSVVTSAAGGTTFAVDGKRQCPDGVWWHVRDAQTTLGWIRNDVGLAQNTADVPELVDAACKSAVNLVVGNQYFSPGNPICGQAFSITVDIKNDSVSMSEPTILVFIDISASGAQNTVTVNVPAIGAGETIKVTGNLGVRRGSANGGRVRIELNPYRTISETNYEDNVPKFGELSIVLDRSC